jgi:undecaprenyl-diphosphatase
VGRAIQRRRPALLGISAAGAGLVAALARAARNRDLRAWDEAVRVWFRDHPHPAARRVAAGGNVLGKAAVLVPLSTAVAGWIAWRRGLRSGAVVPLAPLAATVLQRTLKPLVKGPRPPRAVREGKTGPSFPSGHAAASSSLAWTLSYVLARERLAPRTVLWILAVLGPAVAGGSKLYDERHWLTDILGGLAAGAAIAAATAALHDATRNPAAA